MYDSMKPVAKVTDRRPLGVAVMHAIATSWGAVAYCISIWLVEHRRGQAAERLHEQLRGMSDADLAALRIERHQITQYIKQRLY